MNTPFNFRLTKFPNEAEILRHEVREFLSDALKDVPKETRAETWYGADENFSRKVGQKGWIGLNWPKEHGGAGRSSMERYVILIFPLLRLINILKALFQFYPKKEI